MTTIVRRSGLGITILVIVVLAGCIQPNKTDGTPTVLPGGSQVPPGALGTPSAAPGVPNPADGQVPPAVPDDTHGSGGTGAATAFPTPIPGVNARPPVPTAVPSPSRTLVEPFIQSRGETPNYLLVWYDQQLDTDQLQAFSFTGVAGNPCIGFLLTAMNSANGQWAPINGGLACAPQASIRALSSVALFQTSAGQVYTITFGRVEDSVISAVAVVYDDGSNDQTTPPFLGVFLLKKIGITGVNTIAGINEQGNLEIPHIAPVPVG